LDYIELFVQNNEVYENADKEFPKNKNIDACVSQARGKVDNAVEKPKSPKIIFWGRDSRLKITAEVLSGKTFHSITINFSNQPLHRSGQANYPSSRFFWMKFNSIITESKV